MGLQINPVSVVNQLNGMNQQLNETINNIQTTMTNAEAFAFSDGILKGTAYDKLRAYYRAVHIPLLRAIILYADALIFENISYQNCINGYLSGIGYIDEDGLEDDKRFIRDQIDRAHSLMCVSKASVSSLISSLEHALRLIEEKLQQINDFKGAAAGLYSSMSSYRSMVESGLQQLKGIRIILQRNSYQIDPLSLKWTKDIDKLWQTYAYFQCIQQEFGFDQETIGYMKEVYEALPVKYPEDSQMELDWRFARLMGGFAYDEDNDEYIKPRMKWNSTAGWAIGYKENPDGIATIMDEEYYFTEFLGIPSDDYRKLRYEVRLQNGMSSNRESWKLSDGIDLAKEGPWKNRFNMANNAYGNKEEGIEISEEEFFILWDDRYNNYSTKGDFAHQQIATSAILAVELDKDGSFSNLGVFFQTGAYISDKHTTEAAGWLGDATIGKKGKTLGPDDYKADLDAENITALMKNEGLSYREATVKYYNMLDSGISRADLFLKGHELSYVVDTIYYSIEKPFYREILSPAIGTLGSIINSQDVSKRDVSYEEKLNYIQEHSPAGYNFVKNLQEGVNEMEVYINNSHE